ncbi:AGAP005667-PA-like protein [Anopheles sinensis]|uniref:AGAP005667-PA-like protein n=1 Tax=Anopheles sinensis TaxID=74873 RepID=A0A084VE96_ANOSI|nr:AGAP005667-PA-like protein [Anopheles sinensis]
MYILFDDYSLMMLLINVDLLNAVGLKCELTTCTISDLQSSSETFVYQYLPNDIQTVVFVNLMVPHVDGSILDGLGKLRSQRVYIQQSKDLQQITLTRACSIATLQISRTGLREIRFEENDKLIHLKIQYSNLMSLPKTVGRLTKLFSLDIAHSAILHLDLASFCSSKELHKLTIRQSKLQFIYINEKIMDCLINVASLDISHNQYLAIDLKYFNMFPHIHDINLSSNNIKYLSRMMVSPTLEYLNLAGNRLTSLDLCEWQVPNLATLIVGNNFLRTLPKCLENLTNLTVVELQSNRISFVSIESFALLSMLRSIDLAENNMTAILLNSTHFPPQLNSLKIHHNHITQLNLTFIPVQSLEVDVRNNLITCFDVYSTSPAVSAVQMENNPTDCSWTAPQERELVKCAKKQDETC